MNTEDFLNDSLAYIKKRARGKMVVIRDRVKRVFRKTIPLLIFIIILIHTQYSCKQAKSPVPKNRQSVVYKDLIFDDGTIGVSKIERIDDKIRQSLDSQFDYYVRLPQQSQLQLELNCPYKDLCGVVEISADGTAPQQFQFDKSGSHHIDISSLANTIIRFRFEARFKTPSSKKTDDPYIEWTGLKLLTSDTTFVTSEANQELPPEIIRRLQTYDVIYVVLDAFNAKHSSVYGYPKQTTPFLEQLARESVVFENMFANASYTLASTATLFTSTSPYEHGLITPENFMNPIIPTLSELLAANEIETYLVTRHGLLLGKWGLSRGFSKIFNERFRRFPEKIIEVIHRIYDLPSAKRKFIYIHLNVPHVPYQPPEKFRVFVPDPPPVDFKLTSDSLHDIDSGKLTIHKEQLNYIISWYDSNLFYADHLAQIIFRSLKEVGRLEKSILIVTSDHGEAFLEHGRMQHGTTLFDEMLHVPFIIRFPKKLGIKPERITHLASLIDVAPTLFDVYGIENEANFVGTSLLPMIFFDYPLNPAVHSAGSLENEDLTAVRDLEYKYVRSSTGEMLFHLVEDPAEQQNIIQQHPISAGYYRQLLQAFSGQKPATSHVIDMERMSEEIRQNLNELGYIK